MTLRIEEVFPEIENFLAYIHWNPSAAPAQGVNSPYIIYAHKKIVSILIEWTRNK